MKAGILCLITIYASNWEVRTFLMRLFHGLGVLSVCWNNFLSSFPKLWCLCPGFIFLNFYFHFSYSTCSFFKLKIKKFWQLKIIFKNWNCIFLEAYEVRIDNYWFGNKFITTKWYGKSLYILKLLINQTFSKNVESNRIWSIVCSKLLKISH